MCFERVCLVMLAACVSLHGDVIDKKYKYIKLQGELLFELSDLISGESKIFLEGGPGTHLRTMHTHFPNIRIIGPGY